MRDVKLDRYLLYVKGADICPRCEDMRSDIREVLDRNNHRLIKRLCDSCLREEGW